ncbi:hypothetical protein QBC45DRAFT_321397, partial [Copromyces sp. CBS 386.78]
VDGRGGISKLYFIRLLFYKFREMATNFRFLDFIARIAPINMVANNIKGGILYSLFKFLYSISSLVSLEG